MHLITADGVGAASRAVRHTMLIADRAAGDVDLEVGVVAARLFAVGREDDDVVVPVAALGAAAAAHAALAGVGRKGSDLDALKDTERALVSAVVGFAAEAVGVAGAGGLGHAEPAGDEVCSSSDRKGPSDGVRLGDRGAAAGVVVAVGRARDLLEDEVLVRVSVADLLGLSVVALADATRVQSALGDDWGCSTKASESKGDESRKTHGDCSKMMVGV